MRDGRVRRAYPRDRRRDAPAAGRRSPSGSAGRRGLEVVQLLDGSPAAAAGVRAGDLIVELDGRPIDGVGDLQRVLVGEMIGRRVPVGVERNGSIVSLEVTPVELDR